MKTPLTTLPAELDSGFRGSFYKSKKLGIKMNIEQLEKKINS